MGSSLQGVPPPSPEGTLLVSCRDDAVAMLWDLDSGKHLQTLPQDRPYERFNISEIRGLTETQKEDFRTLGAIEKANERK